MKAHRNYFSFRKETKDEKFGLLNNIEMNYLKEGAFLIYEATQLPSLLIHALIASLCVGWKAIIEYIKSFYCPNMINKLLAVIIL